MKTLSLVSVLVLVLICIFSSNDNANGSVTGTGGVGVVWPQGSFAAYGEPGLHALARLEVEVPTAPALAGWFGMDVIFFGSESFETEAITGDITIPLEQTTTQNAFSFHLGIRLGSSSHRAFFRPHAGVGAGLYIFSTTLKLERMDGQSDDAPLYSEVLDSQACFGWRGFLGANFYFSPRLGVSFDILYDHVLNLNRFAGDEEIERTSRYQGFAVGLVFSTD